MIGAYLPLIVFGAPTYGALIAPISQAVKPVLLGVISNRELHPQLACAVPHAYFGTMQLSIQLSGLASLLGVASVIVAVFCQSALSVLAVVPLLPSQYVIAVLLAVFGRLLQSLLSVGLIVRLVLGANHLLVFCGTTLLYLTHFVGAFSARLLHIGAGLAALALTAARMAPTFAERMRAELVKRFDGADAPAIQAGEGSATLTLTLQ